MNKKAITYGDYLQLDKVLNSQELMSVKAGKPAHDEMLFIIIHQTYELWFKQILHEVDWVVRKFHSSFIDERTIYNSVDKLKRVIEILDILVSQIRVLETMTSLDFLEFRNYLFPASGFQSFQFRQLEVTLGLERDKRLKYNQNQYDSILTDEERKKIQELERRKSLFQLVEKWLERTPFLAFRDFIFVNEYQKSALNLINKERESIKNSFLSEEEKITRSMALDEAENKFLKMLDEDEFNNASNDGCNRLSYRATMAALLISLYRDEPIFHMPYKLIEKLLDIDESLAMWRFRHSQMVMRMLGRKMGTGGSSGYDYLKETVAKHYIFRDFHNISTLLISRDGLPELPEEVKKTLGFYYNEGQAGE